MFWYRLAQWLKSEGIREPDKFLPSNVLKRLTQIPGFSGADIRNTYAVRTWFPYTEPLVRKTKWLRQQKDVDLRKRLLELGYDSTAVNLATSGTSSQEPWGSAVEFTCEWIASRSSGSPTEYQRETLRNSYSRFLGTWRYRLSKCSFCDKPAEIEFWAYGNPVRNCREHGADQLPTSEDAAWKDQSGRRWWRQDLEICYTTPAV